jgi:hypothetical protein
MTAMAETIVELSDPAAAAAEVAAINQHLARVRRIPRSIERAVHDIALGVNGTTLAEWEAVDPRHALIVYRGVVAAQAAVDQRDRNGLRVALETIRQGLASIAERQPVSDDRSPKELVQWLVGVTEVPHARLARLLGVSLRQFQRWVSSAQAAGPEGDDAGKVRAVARIVAQLRFLLTPAGTVAWFGWPRGDLGGRKPAELLDDPERLPELVRAAGAMRSTFAA